MPERYHLGCGDKRLAGYVNVDVRPTPATDLVVDLNELRVPPGAGCFFSHAFFEHLRRDRREGHLRAAREALDPGAGFACYIGLPDFPAIARLYLDRGPGVVGPVFDLFNVYRYTHGQPDDFGEGYYEQLHKSLFDVAEVDDLLGRAGFASWTTFTYRFPGEPVIVTLGFYAVPRQLGADRLAADCRAFLADFDGEFLDADSLAFTGAASRSPVVARALASPARRGLSRVARAASVHLARV